MRVLTAKDFGNVVRERRRELGYTQQELAEACGCGTRFLSDLENGKKTIQFERALDVATMLGLNILVERRG